MKKFLYVTALSCALSIPLAACGTQQAVSVQNYGVQKGAGSTGIHTILPGDTIYKVAQNYQLPVRELIALNKMNAPYSLVTGDRLKLPPPTEYRVKVGDSIGSIATLYDVSPNRLVELNNLQAPYALSSGQLLRLPTPTQKAIEAMNIAKPVELARVAPVVRETTTVTANRLPQNTTLATTPATSLATTPTNVVTTASTSVAAATTTAMGASSPVIVSPSVASAGVNSGVVNVAPPPIKPSVQEASAASSQVEIPAEIPKLSGNGKFMTPVDGNVISGFGPKANGLHNDGINISAVRGTPVRAAENGVVVYTGDDLEGYGNLILVRHEDKLISAYAHLDKILIKRGDIVKRGTSIGTVGDSGQVDRPQLHFEIRKGTKALNPDRYL